MAVTDKPAAKEVDAGKEAASKKKPEEKPEELSDEDKQLKENLELMVERVNDPDPGQGSGPSCNAPAFLSACDETTAAADHSNAACFLQGCRSLHCKASSTRSEQPLLQ
jgi:hypothetical protein